MKIKFRYGLLLIFLAAMILIGGFSFKKAPEDAYDLRCSVEGDVLSFDWNVLNNVDYYLLRMKLDDTPVDDIWVTRPAYELDISNLEVTRISCAVAASGQEFSQECIYRPRDSRLLSAWQSFLKDFNGSVIWLILICVCTAGFVITDYGVNWKMGGGKQRKHEKMSNR